MKWLGHLKTVILHKYWVFRYALLAGIPWRGLVHDLSKFSPTEFGESIHYYTGHRSPILLAREMNNYSRAWLHHKGCNNHHLEYWVDNSADGKLISVPMPFLCALELVCDRLGAARAYLRKEFSVADQLQNLIRENEFSPLVHPQTQLFIRLMFEELAKATDYRTFRNTLRSASNVYRRAWDEAVCTPEPCSIQIEILGNNNADR